MKKKQKTALLTIRFREDLNEVLYNIMKMLDFSLTKRDIIELSFLDFVSKLNGKLIYEGIDLKEYSELVKLEKLRDLAKKERNEILSSSFFLKRVRNDLFKIVLINSKSPNFKEIISKYLTSRKKEANFYKEKDSLLECLYIYETMALNEDLNQMKKYIREELREDEKLLLQRKKNGKI